MHLRVTPPEGKGSWGIDTPILASLWLKTAPRVLISWHFCTRRRLAEQPSGGAGKPPGTALQVREWEVGQSPWERSGAALWVTYCVSSSRKGVDTAKVADACWG